MAEPAPGGGQTVVTVGLLLVWVLLVVFGVICYLNPPWLQELSRPGRAVEARHHKNDGDVLWQEGNYTLAIPQYAMAVKVNPEEGGAYINLASAYLQVGDRARGLEILRQRLQEEKRPTLKCAVCYNLAGALEEEGRWDEAISYYQQALQFGVEQEKVYRKLGVAYMNLQRYQDARDAFEKSMTYQSDPALSYRYMLLRSMDMYYNNPKELAILEELAAQDITPQELARYDMTTIARLQERDVNLAKLHNHLGAVCVELRDLAAAQEHAQRSLQIWPNNADAKRILEVVGQLRQAPAAP
ncbi:MAG TPA: tetratricopeptide repeat protein [Phycisphaerae bacterium]|nr:tetratricopeptide repeat protein [Phycisphaerae bacterium]